MSPLTRRRIANFRANKRGYWSLKIFAGIFALSLGAEFIANDKPLLLSHQGQLYFPVLFVYPETTFGGVLQSETDYRDPYVQDLISDAGWQLWPLIRFDYTTIDRGIDVPAPSPPSTRHWLGADDVARDVLARVKIGRAHV